MFSELIDACFSGSTFSFLMFCFLFTSLVGRAAFTGNHQWILSENYRREEHPPEVYGGKIL